MDVNMWSSYIIYLYFCELATQKLSLSVSTSYCSSLGGKIFGLRSPLDSVKEKLQQVQLNRQGRLYSGLLQQERNTELNSEHNRDGWDL